MIEVKLKFSNSELTSFAEVVSAACDGYEKLRMNKGLDMSQKLLKTIFDRMNLDLKRKLLEYKPRYKHTLKPEQAIAFWLVINPRLEDATIDHATIVCRQLCNYIHQQFN